jgi:NAD(P)-dependent dehydrogenase (short-subunit alcohol dehydrogenase family)
MRIVVLGATGTIGRAVADALAARHEVIRASRKGEAQVDVDDAASVAALLERVGPIDALVSCAGDFSSAFGPLAQLGEAQLAVVKRALSTQLNLVQQGIKRLRDGGSITLTGGVLSRHPMPGTAAIAMAAASMEGFVLSAALEMPRGLRINCITPGWVKETMEQRGMDSSAGMPAKVLAGYYVSAVEGTMNGQIVDPTAS